MNSPTKPDTKLTQPTPDRITNQLYLVAHLVLHRPRAGCTRRPRRGRCAPLVSSAASLILLPVEAENSQPTNQSLTDIYRNENCRRYGLVGALAVLAYLLCQAANSFYLQRKLVPSEQAAPRTVLAGAIMGSIASFSLIILAGVRDESARPARAT